MSNIAVREKLSFSRGEANPIVGAVSSVTYIGIEGGGTKTIALVATSGGEVVARSELGPGNLRLLSDGQLRQLFRRITESCAQPAAVGIGLAGTRDAADLRRVRAAAESVWEDVPLAITHDLAIALAAAETTLADKILVLSGTGSCCYGETADRTVKVGGWGHLLGDRGSGYDIAISALRELIYCYDREQKWALLGQRVLRSLLLNKPDDLIAWIQIATKSEVASLAPVVFEAESDPIAKQILSAAGESLARDAIICAGRLGHNDAKGEPVAFVLAGSVFLKQPSFARTVGRIIKAKSPGAVVAPLQREAAWGAIELARRAAAANKAAQIDAPLQATSAYYVPEFIPATSPTEQRNSNSTRFHEFSTTKMVDVMLDAESETVPALRQERRQILRAVDFAAETLKRGGRILYVGAGTSGRLGVLDASECPPTFRASPDMIQGIIAGGQRALWQAVEGAEDDAEAGASALRSRSVSPKDLVIGIAASGRTPFVWGALGWAQAIGAKTVLLCFNPSLKIKKEHRPDVVIAPNLGPEILTGSTRLKSGTATKIVLNMISTIAMVRMGKVIGNLMVDLNPSNVKLRDRAIRILRELTGCTPEAAEAALEENHWVVKNAWADLAKRKRKSA